MSVPNNAVYVLRVLSQKYHMATLITLPWSASVYMLTHHLESLSLTESFVETLDCVHTLFYIVMHSSCLFSKIF